MDARLLKRGGRPTPGAPGRIPGAAGGTPALPEARLHFFCFAFHASQACQNSAAGRGPVWASPVWASASMLCKVWLSRG